MTAIDKIDGAGTHRSIQTSTVGANQIYNATLADGVSGVGAQVASQTAHNATITGNGLLVNAVQKLANAAGVAFQDTARVAGSEDVPATGIPAIGAMLGLPIVATTSSSVSATAASSVLAMTNTAGFIAGAPVMLEPGTVREEEALIASVILNTSIAVTFKPGGALFTHTASYSLLTFAMYQARQAPGAPGVTAVSSDGMKATYRAGAVAQTFYSTAAAVLVEIKGSSTTTIRVKKIILWAQAATKFYSELTLLRCTGLSAGTPVVANIGKNDVNDLAATAVVNSYTAAATAGAGSAVIDARALSTVNPSATAVMVPTVFDFTRNTEKALILRGVGDVIQIFNNTTTLGTATFGFSVLFEEDNS